MITGEQIRAARKLLGWSRDRLAPRAGLPVNRLGNYELGQRILPLDEVEALKGLSKPLASSSPTATSRGSS